MNTTISIDFDGVVMKLFLGRAWVKQGVEKDQKLVPCKAESIYTSLIQNFRYPVEDVGRSLDDFSDNYDLVLTTSRKECLKKVTLKFIQKLVAIMLIIVSLALGSGLI